MYGGTKMVHVKPTKYMVKRRSKKAKHMKGKSYIVVHRKGYNRRKPRR
jgi:hypothetical protein